MTGFSYVRGETGHVPMPLADSYVRERDGGKADLLSEADYPVVAECKICHGGIRLGHVMQMEWQHAPLEAAVTGGDAA